MNDIIFLYDQVAESISRLRSFAALRATELTSHSDTQDDIDTLTELLAKRDLLVFAASMRNFVEASAGITAAKESKIITSEIFISAGPPFCRDTRISINVYQCLSRILHAVELRILRTAAHYYVITEP